MNRIISYAPLLCAIGWFILLVIGLLIKGVDYKLPFVFSAVVNVVAFAAHFFVVNRKDKQVKDEDPD